MAYFMVSAAFFFHGQRGFVKQEIQVVSLPQRFFHYGRVSLNHPDTWVVFPVPTDAMLMLPGLALA
jgi:hypothetical protein